MLTLLDSGYFVNKQEVCVQKKKKSLWNHARGSLGVHEWCVGVNQNKYRVCGADRDILGNSMHACCELLFSGRISCVCCIGYVDVDGAQGM